MKFCANVSILFKEVPLLERFARAKEAGFSAVEFWWPSGEDLGEIEAATKDAGLEVALFNRAVQLRCGRHARRGSGALERP